jgi:hypothetical protein
MPAALRHRVEDDPSAFQQFAVERGWGDGLPLIPPTPQRVERYVAASNLPAAAVIGQLAPLNSDCTVELVAINAVLAGAPAAAMPLIVATIEAMADPDFELHALNATTASVVPMVIVNGPVRHALDIPFATACLGGGEGNAASVGRAIRLLMRNVAGQRAGLTSQSVFGQPGRTCGVVFGEWEERSPWAPLAQRRGIAGDAVTVFPGMGTMNVLDCVSDSADLLLDILGRSLAYPGANGYLPGFTFSEVVVGINPVWAEIIAASYPDVSAVQDRIWDAAALPIDSWPREYRKPLEEAGRIAADGRVHLMKEKAGRVLLTVCGGLGGLHGLCIHGFGASTSVTRPVPSQAPGQR